MGNDRWGEGYNVVRGVRDGGVCKGSEGCRAGGGVVLRGVGMEVWKMTGVKVRDVENVTGSEGCLGYSM